jgi:hypothetical protein
MGEGEMHTGTLKENPFLRPALTSRLLRNPHKLLPSLLVQLLNCAQFPT